MRGDGCRCLLATLKLCPRYGRHRGRTVALRRVYYTCSCHLKRPTKLLGRSLYAFLPPQDGSVGFLFRSYTGSWTNSCLGHSTRPPLSPPREVLSDLAGVPPCPHPVRRCQTWQSAWSSGFSLGTGYRLLTCPPQLPLGGTCSLPLTGPRPALFIVVSPGAKSRAGHQLESSGSPSLPLGVLRRLRRWVPCLKFSPTCNGGKSSRNF